MSKSERGMKSESSTEDKIGASTKHAEDKVKDIFIKLEETVDHLLKKITARRSAIDNVLQKAKFKPEWELVRQSSLQFDTNGRLHANPWVSEMFADAVPVVQRFQDDLSHLKIRVSYMLATLDKEDTIQNNPTQSWDTPSAQLLTVLKVINSMSTWAVEVQDSWVTYHMTREQFGMDPKLLSVAVPHQSLDRGKALAAWDVKMAGETRGMINTLLYNYIALEDILYRAGHFLYKAEKSGFMLIYS